MSQRVELQKLSLVDRQARNSTESSSSGSPRKSGLQLSIPLGASPGSSGGGADEQQLLYALAAKKRHIVELEQELQAARRELKQLETRYRSVVEPPRGQLQSWHNRVQRTLDGSAGPLTSQITSLFGYGAEQASASAPAPAPAPPLPPRGSGGDLPERTAGGNGGNGGNGGFLKSIVDRFNDLRVDEDEEAEFDRTQNKQMDEFYLKTKPDYDDDEEIEEEETGGTLLSAGARIYRR